MGIDYDGGGYDGAVVLDPVDAYVVTGNCLPRPDAALAPCGEVRFSACTGLPSPVVTGESVQDLSLTWTGWEFLAAHWDVDNIDFDSIVLTALDPRGQVLFVEENLEGTQAPHVAWHDELNAGVVITDSGVHWLDGCGRPAGQYMPFRFEIDYGDIITYSTPAPTIMQTSEGFLAVTGFQGWYEPAEMNPPLSTTLLGPVPGEVQWVPLDSDGPWGRPRHVTGADGFGAWVVAGHSHGARGKMFEVSDTDLEFAYDIDDRFPSGTGGFILDMAEADGELYVLFDGQSVEDGWGQWILQITSSDARMWAFTDADTTLDAMFSLGNEIIVVLIDSGGDSALSLARFDPQSTSEPLVDQIRIGDWGVGWSTAVAPTERGFGMVWEVSRQINMQVFDCCADAAE